MVIVTFLKNLNVKSIIPVLLSFFIFFYFFHSCIGVEKISKSFAENKKQNQSEQSQNTNKEDDPGSGEQNQGQEDPKPSNPDPEQGGQDPKPNKPSQEEPSQEQEWPDKSVVVALDFTGQRCPFCYNMILRLKGEEKKYHPNLIIVAAHTRHYAGPENLGTFESHVYRNSYCSRDGFPTVILNNEKKYPSNGILQYINKVPSIKLELSAKVEENKISYSFTAKQITGREEGLRGKELKYLLLLLENKITGLQCTPNRTIVDFEHNHVLRGALNGEWGESCVLDKEYKGEVDFKPNVKNRDNCDLVLIVLDDKTKHFINAMKVKL